MSQLCCRHETGGWRSELLVRQGVFLSKCPAPVCRLSPLPDQAHQPSRGRTPSAVPLALCPSSSGWRRIWQLFGCRSSLSDCPEAGAAGWFYPPLPGPQYSLRTRHPFAFPSIGHVPLSWMSGGASGAAAAASAWQPLKRLVPGGFLLSRH